MIAIVITILLFLMIDVCIKKKKFNLAYTLLCVILFSMYLCITTFFSFNDIFKLNEKIVTNTAILEIIENEQLTTLNEQLKSKLNTKIESYEFMYENNWFFPVFVKLI